MGITDSGFAPGDGRAAGAEAVRNALQAERSPERAAKQAQFFQTDEGGYGEGDRFLGVPVPNQRKLARRYRALRLQEVVELLQDPFHECRLTALFILVEQFERGDAGQRAAVLEVYLRNLDYVNNWDLVDSSAPKILGRALVADYGGNGTPELLWTLARSDELWRERTAVLATLAFVRAGVFGPTLELAEYQLQHPHDLMQKAVGWMLREVGKRDREVERRFLLRLYRTMPRTMLRYAIEHFPEAERRRFLDGSAGE